MSGHGRWQRHRAPVLDRNGRRRSIRRVANFDGLGMPSFLLTGPKWKRLCGVETREFSGRRMLYYSLEDDVRELLFIGRDELRPGVYAEW